MYACNTHIIFSVSFMILLLILLLLLKHLYWTGVVNRSSICKLDFIHVFLWVFIFYIYIILSFRNLFRCVAVCIDKSFPLLNVCFFFRRVYPCVCRLPCWTARKASTSSTARQLQCSWETGCQRVGSIAIELWSNTHANYWCGTIIIRTYFTLANRPPAVFDTNQLNTFLSHVAGWKKSVAHI